MDEKKRRPSNGIVPNDGTYLGAKKGRALREKQAKEAFDKAWEAQKGLLKNSLVKLFKEKSSISVRWMTMIDWDDSTLTTSRRIKKGLSLLGEGKFPHTAEAVNRAVAIAQEIDLKIKANKFTWQDYPQWLPKNLKPKNPETKKPITLRDAIEAFIEDYWLTKDKGRYQDRENLYDTYLLFYNRLPDWDVIPTKEILDEVAKSYPKSIKRNQCCSALNKIAPYCGLTDYSANQFRLKKKEIKVKAKPKRELSEKEIEQWYSRFPEWVGKENSPSHWELWQWWYGIQATYGFRNHEVLNIYNLDCEYTDDKGRKYYPFTDAENNPRGIIYTKGKGVKRAAFLPQPKKWLEQFNLRKIPQDYYRFMDEIKGLSNYDREKKKSNKTRKYGQFLREHGFTFTAYNLRHAWNVKSHGLGIPVSLIAQNLGHSIQMNQSVYLESMGLKSCIEALENWEKKTPQESGKLSLESQIELLRQENEQLKAIIQQLLESLKSDSHR